MIKAKTNKTIFAILSAVISAVFAIIIGGTYCVTSLNLRYKTNPNTTSIYAANNHYHINNDTLLNPVLFGSGSHNFEISFEYDVPYDFDLRLKYEMVWTTSSKSVDNVIINYANRDNLVVDKDYIYLASTVTNKQGKINIIVGVDFVDPTNKDYFGERLTIKITDVKICESGVAYNEDHPLVSGLTNQAAEMWLMLKEGGSSSSAMVYNYRYDYVHGAPFVGDDTAYYKVIEQRTSADNQTKYNVVQAADWAGGNRTYAGVGIYVYAGIDLRIDVTIKGIWRLDSTNTVTAAISEAGIKFNYTQDFEHYSWDNSKLWETVKFKYYIPAGTIRYINILDSIELTSPALKTTGIKKDSYRMICRNIEINGTSLEYSEGSGDQSIRMINSLSSSGVTASKVYSSNLVEAVNSTKYLGGLYQIQTGTAIPQSYSADISLTNNTANIQSVTAVMKLKYRLSNANRSLTLTTNEGTESETISRVEDLYPVSDFKTSSNTDAQALELAHIARLKNNNNLFYTFSPDAEISTTSVSVLIAPYSSVNVLNYYTALAELQTTIVDTYGNYDVWLYYDITVNYSSTTSTTNLQIETRQNGNNVDIYAKNNTQQVATITENTLLVRENVISYSQTPQTSEPNDWLATFWQYHYGANNTQNTSTYFDENKEYHLREQSFDVRTISNKVSSGTLRPGEVLKVGTITVAATKDLLFEGKITASLSDLQEIVVCNAGTQEAVLINGTNNLSSSKSVYVRIKGVLSSQNTNDRLVQSGEYIYYIGILRPGQKICVNMTSGAGTISTIDATDLYTESTLSSWNDNTISAKFNDLFNVSKSVQS